ncbi:MAG: amidohydrolase [Desulfobacterales bacterium]|nr:amidohydrolase [Desulfobacterales bacterium]
MNATLGFVNGNVITMNGRVTAEAVAVENGRITGVGTTREILDMTNRMTHIIDLKGRTLLPGFIDTHTHILGFGFSFESVDLFNTRSCPELVDRCKQHILENKIPEGSWVLGRGFNQNEFRDGKEFPTTGVLNAISTEHPILLLRTDGHIGITNDLALELAGVDETTFIRGGCFDKDENGKPNGVIREAALEWFKQQISGFRTTEDLKRAIRTGGSALSGFGITSVHTEDSYDLGYSGDLDDIHEAYRQLTIENNMPVRVYQKVSLPRKAELLEFLKQPLRTGHGNDFFRMGPMKLWTDGTIGARTAALREDYTDEPGQTGIYLYEDDELRDLLQTAHDNDMQTCLHSIGDGSLEQVVTCLEGLIGKKGNRLRHRIVHCQVGSRSQYERIGRLGLSVNIQPIQTATDYPLIEYRLGKKRASACHAWQTCIDCGVNLTGSSDVPCTYSEDAANVFHGIHAIVNRDAWLPQEAVSVYDALKMYTVNAAVSAFEEDVKGSVEPGKFADLIVVDKDPLSVDKKELRHLNVEMTFLGGRLMAKG